MRHAIIDTEVGAVVNVVDYEGDITGTTPPGFPPEHIAVASGTAQIGWAWDGVTLRDTRVYPLPDVNALRAAAYRERSDPLFFKWQRGTATKEEWLAEIAAIKAEFPDAG